MSVWWSLHMAFHSLPALRFCGIETHKSSCCHDIVDKWPKFSATCFPHWQCNLYSSSANCKSSKDGCACITSGPYITFSIWGAMSLGEVVNMAVWKLLTLGGSEGILPQEILMILGVLRHILVHYEAYREAHRASWKEGSSSKSSLLAVLLEHWKSSPSARVYYLYLFIGGTGSKFEV